MNLRQSLKQRRDLRHKKRREIRRKANNSSPVRTAKIQLMYNLKRLAIKEKLMKERAKRDKLKFA